MLSSPKGKVVRADYTRVEATPQSTAALAPGGRGVAVRAHPRRGHHLARAGAGGGRDAGRDRLEQKPRGWARFAPLPVPRRREATGPGCARRASRGCSHEVVGLGRGRPRRRAPRGGRDPAARAARGGRARRRAPVALDAVQLAEPRLAGTARERLARTVGEEHVRDDREARVAHAAGRSYPDLVRLRSGRLEAAPDAVRRARLARGGRPRCWPPAPSRAWRSCRSGAARASSAAWTR